jgi:hypothetical protein
VEEAAIGFAYLLLRKPPETRLATAPGLQPMTRQQVLDAPTTACGGWPLHGVAQAARALLHYRPGVCRARLAGAVGRALRFHAPPLALDDLPALTAVILSHDHFDHLMSTRFAAWRHAPSTSSHRWALATC